MDSTKVLISADLRTLMDAGYLMERAETGRGILFRAVPRDGRPILRATASTDEAAIADLMKQFRTAQGSSGA